MLCLFRSFHSSRLPAFPLEFPCLCGYVHMRVSRESQRREASIQAVHFFPAAPSACHLLLTSVSALCPCCAASRAHPCTAWLPSACPLSCACHASAGESGAHPACPPLCPLSSRALSSWQARNSNEPVSPCLPSLCPARPAPRPSPVTSFLCSLPACLAPGAHSSPASPLPLSSHSLCLSIYTL